MKQIFVYNIFNQTSKQVCTNNEKKNEKSKQVINLREADNHKIDYPSKLTRKANINGQVALRYVRPVHAHVTMLLIPK